jgi:hypothetical protein
VRESTSRFDDRNPVHQAASSPDHARDPPYHSIHRYVQVSKRLGRSKGTPQDLNRFADWCYYVVEPVARGQPGGVFPSYESGEGGGSAGKPFDWSIGFSFGGELFSLGEGMKGVTEMKTPAVLKRSAIALVVLLLLAQMASVIEAAPPGKGKPSHTWPFRG